MELKKFNEMNNDNMSNDFSLDKPYIILVFDASLKNDKEELLRRVTPEERLLLQGFPVDWYDGLDLTDTDKFTMCGMCTNTVKYIGDCIINFDNSLK